MSWKGRYSTHKHFSYLVLKKTKGEGQDTVIGLAHIHPELTTPLCLHCYQRGKPSSPELGTRKYPTLMFFASHQVFNSKI